MGYTKEFILNTNDKNSHGYHVLTDGIVLPASLEVPAFFNHETYEMPIGKFSNLRKEGGVLKGFFVSNGDTEAEKIIITKIENGELNGASIGADIISGEEKDGTHTITACKLYEVSIVALPANANAIKLKKDGKDYLFEPIKNKANMNVVKQKLGLAETATEQDIVSAIEGLQLKKQTEQKEEQVKAIEEQQIQLAKKISDLLKPAEQKNEVVKTFDWYQKNDSKALMELKRDKPKEYKQLWTEHLKVKYFTH